jgi:hypothetical protein
MTKKKQKKCLFLKKFLKYRCINVKKMNEYTTRVNNDNEQSNSNTTDDDELDENNKQVDGRFLIIIIILNKNQIFLKECEREAKWLEEVGLEEIAQNFKSNFFVVDLI